MSEATKKTETKSELETSLELQEMNIEELVAKAKELGVVLKTTDKSAIIDEIIAAGVQGKSEALESGTLLSLHTRTEEAAELVRSARQAIVNNEQGGQYFTVFLKNINGEKYSNRIPGVRLSEARVPAILDLVCTVPDGSQDAILEEFKASPENFKQPLLVRVRRPNKAAGQGFQNFVMLYLERKPATSTAQSEF